MSTILLLCFAAFANAEDFTGTPFHWPDMLHNGGRVVQILTENTTGRPAEWNYPTWYSKYPMRFVEDIPVPPGNEVAGAELVVLEYDITDKMGFGAQQIKEESDKFGAAGKAWMDAFSPKHNELGLIAKDKSGNEVGRFVFSLWPIGNDEIKHRNSKLDMRQFPHKINVSNVSTVVVKNRAVTSIELSKAYTWWGLPKDTKMIHVSNLNKQGYYRTLQAVKDFAKNHPYFNDFEVTAPDGTIKMPAVTCNTLIEYVTKIGSNQDAFQDGLSKMGYLQLALKKSKSSLESSRDNSLFKSYPTKYVRDLMGNRKLFNAHFNKDLFVIPAYYNQNGNTLAKGCKEDPEQWHVVWAKAQTWRQNYAMAETFQLKSGYKQGKAMGNQIEEALVPEPAVHEASHKALVPQPAVHEASHKAGKKLDLKGEADRKDDRHPMHSAATREKTDRRAKDRGEKVNKEQNDAMNERNGMKEEQHRAAKEADDGKKHDWIWKLRKDKEVSEGKTPVAEEEKHDEEKHVEEKHGKTPVAEEEKHQEEKHVEEKHVEEKHEEEKHVEEKSGKKNMLKNKKGPSPTSTEALVKAMKARQKAANALRGPRDITPGVGTAVLNGGKRALHLA